MSYTAVINGLKIVLPLVALGLLSTLFLFARDMPDEASLPYIEDLRERGDGVDGMRSSFYTGSTDAGDAITIDAGAVRPDPEDPDLTRAETLRARINYVDGANLVIRSDDAVFSDRNATLTLSGDVTLQSSSGYEVLTEALVAQTEDGTAISPGPVSATGPAGTLTAGGMQVRRGVDAETGSQLVFTDGVKLVYTPTTDGE